MPSLAQEKMTRVSSWLTGRTVIYNQNETRRSFN